MPEAVKLQIEKIIKDILQTIDREREREIIARRFGLYDRKETLEQIGELLGITRERVRQLEKAVVARLKTQAASDELPHVGTVQAVFIEKLADMGNVARVADLSAKFSKDNDKIYQSRVSFLAQLCPKLVTIDENDYYFHSVGRKSHHDEKEIKNYVDRIIKAIKEIGEPVEIGEVAKAAKVDNARHTAALASTSKKLATLNGRWGLIKWPMVNPKNIRDKIYDRPSLAPLL